MDFDQLVEEYLKENEETINKEELLEITKLFYSFVRQEIESGNLHQVRIKYFGSFNYFKSYFNIHYTGINSKTPSSTIVVVILFPTIGILVLS